MTDAGASRQSQTDAIAHAEGIGRPHALRSPDVFRGLVRRPAAAEATADLLLAGLFRGVSDDRPSELVMMRIGWVSGSDDRWSQHVAIAQVSSGCSLEDLFAVRDGDRTDRFDESVRAVLARLTKRSKLAVCLPRPSRVVERHSATTQRSDWYSRSACGKPSRSLPARSFPKASKSHSNQTSRLRPEGTPS